MNERHDTARLPRRKPGERFLPAGVSSLVEVDVAAVSHPGRVRQNNEDHFIASRFERAMETLASNLPEGEIPARYSETVYGYLVADGVGGTRGGEVASRTATETLMELVLETPDWIMRLDDPLADEVLQRMEGRFQKIREVLRERAAADPSLLGMATTLTVACTLGAELMTAHVGDSRAYLRRAKGALVRLTRDQTMAQSLADAGAITAEEAARHPGRHVLTGALAIRGAFAQVELKRTRLEDGDQLLLCSDGLTEMVSEEAIERVLARAAPSARACQELVDLALEAGGKDNVTVVLGRYRIPATVSA